MNSCVKFEENDFKKIGQKSVARFNSDRQQTKLNNVCKKTNTENKFTTYKGKN